jgi:phospholipid/cholesterol/gamma-HCH transport system permease protein
MSENFLLFTKQASGHYHFAFPEQVKTNNCAQFLTALKKNIKEDLRLLSIDFAQTKHLNDFGILLLLEIKKQAQEKSFEFKFENLTQEIDQVLKLVNFKELQPEMCTVPKALTPNLFVRQGDFFFKSIQDIKQLHEFIGELIFACFKLILRPDKLRYRELILNMQKVGVDALPIVALISFLLGLIIAFMSAVQLQQFGANIYVASLVSLAMVKELGPIMTAILIAGRSGSAFAAEIGSMKISEEIDALRTMGLDVNLFLVMPKLLASIMVVPILVLFSDLFGIAGGLLIGVSMLNLTVQGFIHQTIESLTLFDLLWSVFKSGIFALLIAWIGCFRGFQTEGGASGVGKSTTSAVVSGIFLIILVDSILAVILRYWG